MVRDALGYLPLVEGVASSQLRHQAGTADNLIQEWDKGAGRFFIACSTRVAVVATASWVNRTIGVAVTASGCRGTRNKDSWPLASAII